MPLLRKRTHEIRDPIHTFIKVDNWEREIIDSTPFQRLRNIHQLALTYLVYPGATHRRFEHSLGVMDLAGRVFDIVTNPENVKFDSVRDIIPDAADLQYWRRVLRAAALCHDMGHLPYSHAAEIELLPQGTTHEDLTVSLIRSEYLGSVWRSGPLIDPDHVAKIAVGKKGLPDAEFTEWEAILSEIIIGDALGVDRIDYLLRDSHHAGVAYGRFDHHRLIESIRILPRSTEEGGSTEPVLGIEQGGLHSAEALLLARYFMYEQVYFHHVRRIYDIHLKEFMLAHFGDKKYPTEPAEHLTISDNDIATAMHAAGRTPDVKGHEPAKAIMDIAHFKKIYERNEGDHRFDVDAANRIFEAVSERFGREQFRFDTQRQTSNPSDFPVLIEGDRVDSSLNLSDIMLNLPLTAIDFVFCRREIATEARAWIEANRVNIVPRGNG